MNITSYRDLKVWQQSMELAELAYVFTAGFPRSELFGLTCQIRRSAASVPANIAEGYGRHSAGSYVHFLKTARGSLREFEKHVLLAQRIGYLRQPLADKHISHAESIGKMLGALISAIEKSPRA